MSTLIIQGGKELSGEVWISGSKNSALPIVCAALLNQGITEITNVANISDIEDLLEIISELNVFYEFKNNLLTIDSSRIKNTKLMNPKINKIRGSYYLLSVLVTLFNQVEMSMPGGCKIGERPLDLHYYAFNELGVKVEEKENLIILKRNHAATSHLIFRTKSVGATINAIITALTLDTEVLIENVSMEPEVVDVVQFLNKLGYKIVIHKNAYQVIPKKPIYRYVLYKIIPDRIEAATFLIMGLLCGKLSIYNVEPKHMKHLIHLLQEHGAGIEVGKDFIMVEKSNLSGMEIIVKEYPGFPTDVQPLICPLLALTQGKSTIKENIFSQRFSTCNNLNKMGASISIEGDKAFFEGVEELYGKEVIATDLRCAAGLVIAGLKANGETRIKNIEYLFRGYENILEKLTKIDADVTLEIE